MAEVMRVLGLRHNCVADFLDLVCIRVAAAGEQCSARRQNFQVFVQTLNRSVNFSIALLQRFPYHKYLW